VGITDDSNDQGAQEALRVEWCRSRAHAMRWSEEVVLLREEIWHAGWWTGRRMLHESLTSELTEGMIAYAMMQATIRQLIRGSFRRLWRGSDELISSGLGADNDVLDLPEAASHKLLDMPPLG